MSEKYGRHFCYKCGKLIKPGEAFEWHAAPAPFRREMKHSYAHYGKCPSLQSSGK